MSRGAEEGSERQLISRAGNASRARPKAEQGTEAPAALTPYRGG
jgi:hypothetical protein